MKRQIVFALMLMGLAFVIPVQSIAADIPNKADAEMTATSLVNPDGDSGTDAGGKTDKGNQGTDKSNKAKGNASTADNAVLQALMQNPESIGEYIADANEQEAAMLIIQVISLMQAEKMENAAIQQAVGTMFQTTAEVKGAEFGSAVVSLVKKQVNPRLLPIIRMGSAPSTPPGSAPRYPNQ